MKKVFIICLLVIVSSLSKGTNYHVAKTGLNTNEGTFAFPYLTITQGLSVANAGDTVFVREGVYQESVSFPRSGTSGSPIVLRNYQGAIVTVDAQSTRVYGIYASDKDYISIIGIRTKDPLNYGIKFMNCSNTLLDSCQATNTTLSNTIENILIENTTRKSNYIIKNCYASNGSNGIAIMGMTTNTLIQNCEVENTYYTGVTVTCTTDTASAPHQTVIDGVYSHNNGRTGIGTRILVDVTVKNSHLAYNSATGIQIEAMSYNSIVEDNVCEYNSRSSEFETGIWIYNSTNSIVRRNITRGNQTGIRCWNMINFQIYNNLIIDNNYQPGGSVINTSGADFRNAAGTFYNNVLVGNSASNSKLGSVHVYPEGVNNITFKNNIIMNDGSVDTPKDMDFDQAAGSTVISDNNLIYNANRTISIQVGDLNYTWVNYKSTTGQDAHSLNANPLFVDPANGNFRLQSNSPAINAGVNVGLIYDYLGNLIVGNPDIGAYEYCAPHAPRVPTHYTIMFNGKRLVRAGKTIIDN